jgi:hypothetical protein
MSIKARVPKSGNTGEHLPSDPVLSHPVRAGSHAQSPELDRRLPTAALSFLRRTDAGGGAVRWGVR